MAVLVPRLVAGIDVRTFKLDAMDGFLMTRIDGRLTPKELARDTGMPDFTVDRVLEKMTKMGVVEMIDPTAPPPPKVEAKKPELPTFGASISEPKYDPKELEEEVDLTIDQKTRILDLFYRLDDMDHYTLLGIGAEADKKGVKRAYFELAAVMHPDRYFQKKIGSFKAKMEELFTRITEAHDTLVDVAKRTEYDSYIKEVATTRGMEAMFERAIEESRRAAVAAPAPGPRQPSTPEREPSVPPVQIHIGPSASEMQARREALARRLTGGNGSVRPPPKQPSTPPKETNPLRYSNSADAVDALKRRYEERIDTATLAQARKYADAAEDAYRKNDLIAAASSYGIAVKFAPNDVAMAMRFQEVKNEADKVLVESYTKQAIYEERSAHWPEAARNWEKVAKLKPLDARAHERAAHSILRSDGDATRLHQAAEHAKAALSADPSIIAHHVTLAEVYAAAALTASAKRAAETGLQLDPKNATLLALVKKLGK